MNSLRTYYAAHAIPVIENPHTSGALDIDPAVDDNVVIGIAVVTADDTAGVDLVVSRRDFYDLSAESFYQRYLLPAIARLKHSTWREGQMAGQSK